MQRHSKDQKRVAVPASKASVIISKEWKKVKTSKKKIKKYKDLYEEEKQRHEETFQRYQEDHMDEMEIINLHKRCNKKVPQPKKAPFKSDEPKKAPEPPEFIGDPSKEEQRFKKVDGKKVAYKGRKKKLKRPHSRKKHQSHLNLFTQVGKKKSRPRMIKVFLYWG